MNRTSTRKQPLADLTSYIPLSIISTQQATDLIDGIVESLDERWFRWGNCIGKNPDFFCAPDYTSEQTPQPEAAELCAMCPVKTQCAKKALQNLDDHSWTVMGGVSLPFNPRKSNRAQRQLEKASEEDPYVRRKVAWHVVMSLYALKAKKFDTLGAWSMIHDKVDWGVFVRTCAKIGLTAPRSPEIVAKIDEKATKDETEGAAR